MQMKRTIPSLSKSVVHCSVFPLVGVCPAPYTMKAMFRRSFYMLALLVALAGLLGSSFVLQAQDSDHRGRKFKKLPPQARVQINVVRDVNDKPIENAAVIFHLVGDKGNMELKTNDEGKAVLDVLSLGSTVELQIIARGYQTYGGVYKLDKPDQTIDIRMKRPGEVYSIYKPHPANGDAQKPATEAKPGEQKPAGEAPAQPKQ